MTPELMGLFVRTIPVHLATQVASGEYAVYGSVVRSVATGQIRGWLTEAGGMAQVASALLKNAPVAAMPTPATIPVAAANLGLNIASVVQGEQIKAGIATLQQLQLGGLALGAAGIGVSVVGFAILSRKIDRVVASVDAVGDKLDLLAAKVEANGREPVLRDLDALRTATREMDGGWALSSQASARAHWEAVARAANGLATGFERRARDLLAGGVGALPLAEPMLDALALATATRVSAWAAAGEERYARDEAAQAAIVIEGLTSRIGSVEIARAKMAQENAKPATLDYSCALERATKAAMLTSMRLREREAATATRGAMLIELDRRGVRARDWMKVAREVQDSPVVLLEPAQG